MLVTYDAKIVVCSFQPFTGDFLKVTCSSSLSQLGKWGKKSKNEVFVRIDVDLLSADPRGFQKEILGSGPA